MHYCFDCDSYNCRCWLEEYQEYIATEAEAKENLPKLLEAMEVTKEEVRELILAIKNGRLDGNYLIHPVKENCGCIIGLTSCIRKTDIPYEHIALSSVTEGSTYAAIQEFIVHPENHALVVKWLEELL